MSSFVYILHGNNLILIGDVTRVCEAEPRCNSGRDSREHQDSSWEHEARNSVLWHRHAL